MIREEGQVLVVRDEVLPTSMSALVGGIPAHRAYFAWRGPDGAFLVGVGHAWRMMSSGRSDAPGLSRLLALMKAAAGPLFAEDVRAFGWTYFDPNVTSSGQEAGPGWETFSPLELTIPEILFLGQSDGTLTRLCICDAPRLENVRASADAILKRQAHPEETSPGLELGWNDEAFAALVREGLAAIDAGDVQKVVLARRVEGRATRSFDVAATLAAMIEQHPTCFVFALRPGGSQQGAAPVFIGATPERLVRVEDRTLHTEALAGTAARGVSAAMDERLGNELLMSDKDRREHELVCQRVESTLEPFVSSVRRSVGVPAIKRLKNVQHLHTPIVAELNADASILDVVTALHPTPAVGGTPREPARELIARLEAAPRGLYAGTAGWVDAEGNGEFAVLIRSALVQRDRLALFAGAGIVSGSDPETETEETRIKANAILECLR